MGRLAAIGRRGEIFLEVSLGCGQAFALANQGCGGSVVGGEVVRVELGGELEGFIELGPAAGSGQDFNEGAPAVGPARVEFEELAGARFKRCEIQRRMVEIILRQVGESVVVLGIGRDGPQAGIQFGGGVFALSGESGAGHPAAGGVDFRDPGGERFGLGFVAAEEGRRGEVIEHKGKEAVDIFGIEGHGGFQFLAGTARQAQLFEHGGLLGGTAEDGAELRVIVRVVGLEGDGAFGVAQGAFKIAESEKRFGEEPGGDGVGGLGLGDGSEEGFGAEDVAGFD